MRNICVQFPSFFQVERRMAEHEESVSALSFLFFLLVEITNLYLHGRGSYACSVMAMKIEGGKTEALTQFTSIMDYFNAHSSTAIPVQKCLKRSKREDIIKHSINLCKFLSHNLVSEGIYF